MYKAAASVHTDLRPVNNRRASASVCHKPHELRTVKVTATGGAAFLGAFAFKIQSSESRPQQRDRQGQARMEGNSAEVSIGPAAFLMQPWK